MTTVAFRADASVAIGTGHVMRCLTLADALAAGGGRCVFLCRDLPGHMGASITARGHGLHLLPPAPPGSDGLAHSVWLGTTMAADAAHCAPHLAELAPDWLVVDHYALDARWTQATCPAGTRVAVLDDLADRRQEAAVLIDATLGRRPGDYDRLLPEGALRLTGPQFALLRPEFTALRPESLARRDGRLARVLVAMGGIDRENATGRALAALAGRAMAVDVVLGGQAPHLDAVRAQVAALPGARLHVDTPDVARLMRDADLAVGAAGGTAWERCALGLPTLMLVTAENQTDVAAALARAGAVLPLGRVTDADWPERIAAALDRLPLRRMATRAARLTDARGAERVARLLRKLPGLVLRPAAMDDAEAVWRWRQAAGAAQYYADPAPTPLDDHLRWFRAALADPARRLRMVCAADRAIAHLRCDGPRNELSIVLDPEARGQGLAAPALALAMAEPPVPAAFTARVHAENLVSQRLFEGLGFVRRRAAPPLLHYRLIWRDP